MAEQEKDFFSFDEALDQLRLKEEELKRLVSEGEIRAFRDGETMKLRRSDVDNLRVELSGGEVVDLGSSGEDLVFEDDADFGDTGMATEEISEADTILDDVEDVGEVDIDDEVATPVASTRPARRAPAAVAIEEEEESVGMKTVLFGTTVVLLLALPVLMSVSSGHVIALARLIAGIFQQDLPE